MKWAKLGKPDNSPDNRMSYEYYDQKKLNETFGLTGSTPDSNGRIIKPSPNLWIRYRFRKSVKPEKQRDYEIYCGGFLQFYDIEVRNRATNHILHFDWSKSIKGFYYVSIFISPRPYPNNKISSAEVDAVTIKPSAAASKTSEAATSSADVWEEEYGAIDPPPPPPPPPPSRE